MQIKLKESVNNAINDGISTELTMEYISRRHNAPIELIELMMEWGVDVEIEYAENSDIAKNTAMRNLLKDPVYYKKLQELEPK